jgi:tRNA 2-thiouridine synthesizing protein A
MQDAPELIDARGLRCPLPVLKLEKALERLPPGGALVLFATDPVAKIDIPLYCAQHGHACEISAEDDALRFAVTKAGAA